MWRDRVVEWCTGFYHITIPQRLASSIFGALLILVCWYSTTNPLFSTPLLQSSSSVSSSRRPSPSCTTTEFSAVLERAARRSGHTSRRKALVTGAGGFIGSHVADFVLLNLNFSVVAIDDLSGGFMSNLETFIQGGGLVEIGDIKNASFIDEVFAKHGPFDYVYHIAAYAAEGLSHFIRRFNYENNLVGSVNLLNAAINQRSELSAFIFTSSIAAYGASDGVPPFTESSPKTPEDPYGISKMAFELDLKAAHHMFGLKYIIFRPHNVYGPRQNIADKFRNAVGIFMNQILRNESITIFGDGTQKRAFSYITDVSNVIGASVLFKDAHNNDFFVGNDHEYTVNELAQAVVKAMGSTNVSIKHLSKRNEVVDAFPFHEKLRCVFNPPSPVELNRGLQLTADYVRRHGSFEPTGYMNIEIQKMMPPSWALWLQAKPKQ